MNRYEHGLKIYVNVHNCAFHQTRVTAIFRTGKLILLCLIVSEFFVYLVIYNHFIIQNKNIFHSENILFLYKLLLLCLSQSKYYLCHFNPALSCLNIQGLRSRRKVGQIDSKWNKFETIFKIRFQQAYILFRCGKSY